MVKQGWQEPATSALKTLIPSRSVRTASAKHLEPADVAACRIPGLAKSPGGAVISLGLLVICLVVTVPYFRYVIEFARPENIIFRLRHQMERRLPRSGASEGRISAARVRVIKNVEGLSDIAVRGIANVDRWLVQAAVWSLQGFLDTYLRNKMFTE